MGTLGEGNNGKGRLIILSGLPGVGKTTIAKELARHLGAVHLRIDSIEQAMRNSGSEWVEDAGYCIAYVVAEDNLRLGWTVIADCVNPIQLTRDAWMEVAHRAGVKAAEVEITCSDAVTHRQRVETRSADIEGLRLPNWQEVVSREYAPWNRARVVIDTAGKTVLQAAEELRRALARFPNSAQLPAIDQSHPSR